MERADEVATAASDCVYAAMTRAGLSISELAEKSGIARPMVSMIVNAKKKFRVDTFFILIEACGQEVMTRKRRVTYRVR